METHVFFRGKVPTKAAVARAMRDLGFPFTMPGAKGSLEAQSGFMPMKLHGEETGVEFDLYQDRAAIAEFATHGVEQSYERMASFRWSGDMQEAAAGLCGAAALAKITNGVVFDESEGRVLSVAEAIAVARRNINLLPKSGIGRRRSATRIADIRRYLTPLLALRSDLVLVDRMLVIRPVRHLLRGALLDRTRDPNVLLLHWFIKPLYPGAHGTDGEQVTHLDARMPDFEAMLLDFLAGDVFDAVGQVTSFDDYMTFWGARPNPPSLFTPTLLGKGLEHASDYLKRFQQGPVPAWLTESRALLQRDIRQTFDHYHKLESNTVNELGIGDIWERSAFPAEVGAQNVAATSEPSFLTTPWVKYSTSWRQDAPDVPGEVRFGVSWRLRAIARFL